MMAARAEARHPRERILVALDRVRDEAEVREIVSLLGGEVGGFKVGLQAFTRCGPSLVAALRRAGKTVFLDLKFHDIPATVRDAAREAGRLGVQLFNVHALGGRAMLEAAVEGAHLGAEEAGVERPKVLAVTVLTSLGDAELAGELGLSGTAEEAVLRLAGLARAAGLDGVVASAREVAQIKRSCGEGFLVVTPGIRPRWAAANDQVRVVTPADALARGADYLVIGRAILRPPAPLTPLEAARKINAELSP
jgi:orotidine-5'-phosphate decarboxylase